MDDKSFLKGAWSLVRASEPF